MPKKATPPPEPDPKFSAQLRAVQAIYDALKPLDNEERTKVLGAVLVLGGWIDAVPVSSPLRGR